MKPSDTDIWNGIVSKIEVRQAKKGKTTTNEDEIQIIQHNKSTSPTSILKSKQPQNFSKRAANSNNNYNEDAVIVKKTRYKKVNAESDNRRACIRGMSDKLIPSSRKIQLSSLGTYAFKTRVTIKLTIPASDKPLKSTLRPSQPTPST